MARLITREKKEMGPIDWGDDWNLQREGCVRSKVQWRVVLERRDEGDEGRNVMVRTRD